MNRKIVISLLITALLSTAPLVEAQQPKKVPRIGYLVGGSLSAAAARTEAFLQGLRELGYVEGKDTVIEYRYADGKIDRLRDLAAELVRLNVDVIVAAGGTATALAAR